MFQGMKSKLDDMRTIKRLCEGAEAYALMDQQREPGAEHFLLAAFDLPDGTARLAFEQAGIASDALRAAIERQYVDALASIGLKAAIPTDTPMPAHPGIYHTAASGREIMQELAATGRIIARCSVPMSSHLSRACRMAWRRARFAPWAPMPSC